MIFFGRVSVAGILELDHPELYSDLLKGKLANCRVQLTSTGRKHSARSSSLRTSSLQSTRRLQNTGSSIPEVHEVCKQMFLPPRQLTILDQTVTVPGSTALLTTGEMVEYTERCIGLAHELGCVVQTHRRRRDT
jgi:hypothetical protein